MSVSFIGEDGPPRPSTSLDGRKGRSTPVEAASPTPQQRPATTTPGQRRDGRGTMVVPQKRAVSPGLSSVGRPTSSASRTSTVFSSFGSMSLTSSALGVRRVKQRKDRLFVQDNSDKEHVLPRPLSGGLAIAADIADFQALGNRDVWSAPMEEKTFIAQEEANAIYEARCKDQKCATSYDRHERFIELLCTRCKGQWFVLRQCGIERHAAEAIKETLLLNHNYTHVDLSGNSLGIDGGHHVAELLRGNDTIVVLRLQSANLGDSIIEIADALAENNTLTALDLSGIAGMHRNSIGKKAAAAMGNMLLNNVVLTSLNFSCCGIQRHSASIIRSCSAHEALTSLDFSSNDLRDDGCESLQLLLSHGSCRLEELNLESNSITCIGMSKLATALKLNNRSATTLQVFKLGNNRIGSQGCRVLAGAIRENQSITNLSLHHNPLMKEPLDEDGIPSPASINGISDLFVAIAANQQLKIFTVAECNLRELPSTLEDVLHRNTVLERLDLSGNGFGDDGARIIARGLSYGCGGLTHFNFARNRITTAGAKPIVDGLRKNHTIKNLKMAQGGLRLNVRDAGYVQLLRDNLVIQHIDMPKEYHDETAAFLERNGRRAAETETPQLESKIKALSVQEKDLHHTRNLIHEERKRREKAVETAKVTREKNKVILSNYRNDIQTLEDQNDRVTAQRNTADRELMLEEDEKAESRKRMENEQRRAARRVESQVEGREEALNQVYQVTKQIDALKKEEETALMAPHGAALDVKTDPLGETNRTPRSGRRRSSTTARRKSVNIEIPPEQLAILEAESEYRMVRNDLDDLKSEVAVLKRLVTEGDEKLKANGIYVFGKNDSGAKQTVAGDKGRVAKKGKR